MQPKTFDPKLLDIKLKWWGVKRKTIKVPDGWVALPKSDLFIDCRVVPEKGIRGFTGDSPEFQAGVLAKAPQTIKRILETILEGLALAGDRRSGEDPYSKSFEICLFCAWGIHRSVSTTHLIAERLKKLGYKVTLPSQETSGQGRCTFASSKPLAHKLPMPFGVLNPK